MYEGNTNLSMHTVGEYIIAPERPEHVQGMAFAISGHAISAAISLSTL
jgi:hypothetical protein